jgi:hypothetical protein
VGAAHVESAGRSGAAMMARDRDDRDAQALAARQGGVVAYFDESALDDDLARLRAEGCVLYEFHAWGWLHMGAFHDEMASVFGLPDDYGRNLDALMDCLRDVEAPLEGGMAVVVRGVEAVYPELSFALHVFELLADRARASRLRGRRLLVLLHSNDPSIDLTSLCNPEGP